MLKIDHALWVSRLKQGFVNDFRTTGYGSHVCACDPTGDFREVTR